MVARQQESPASQGDVENREDLLRQQRALYLRLEDGYSRIEQAIADGQAIERWEDLWLRLLAEYERISDQLSEAA